MPEGVAKEAKEDAKAKSKEASPRRRPAGNTAKVKVELLDGSTMELDADRKIRGHDLLGKVCDSLNLVEKDYFGLLYEDRGDPRVWIDLEKRVSKMLKHEPWNVRFAVKFYPPEPAQLQEELTRYQLVLAIRKDLLQGRLPCSTVTHALLASYLLQSELGDYEETEVDAGLCKQLKLVPPSACTPELEAKVVELHKTHRGQTPAEAELNYLENAKKLAMYGVDLHPAKDSENVDITLGVCSSGLLVHREKLRINRFAWPKILKISYKRHNFYVKLRPGEFEQFESTVGFKLANHRAAKKLWKTCVEHHTFFRLMSPEPAQKSTLFPRLGSRFRYSGRTHYESRAAPPQRAPPHFSRTLSNRKLSSRSMDALAAGDKDDTMPPEAAKRHTMPPQPAPRPTVKDKKPPPGAVKVMPTAPPDKDKKLEQRKPAENGTDTSSDPGITNNVETTPKKSRGGFGLFGGKKDKSPKEEKSPRDKSPKSKSPKDKDKKIKDPKAKVAVLDTSIDSANLDSSAEKPSFTKPYEYTDTEKSPSRTKPFIQGAFSYEKEPISEEKQRGLDDSQSPTTRKAGLAFNYAPGEDKKVAESAEKRKTPEDPSKLKTPGIDYVQSAALKEQAKSLIDPTLALLNAERAHHEVPVVIAPVAAKKPENEIQVVIITGRYNPKSKKLDDANGTILVTRGTLNKANGKIQTEKELIDTKSGNVTYTDPMSGKQETKNGHVDSKSGHILFTSGVIDPKTGKLDPTLAQQYCFVERSQDKVGIKPGKEVDLVVITGKYDGKHKKLDASHGHVDVSRAVVGPHGNVTSNYGVIDPRTGKIDYIDSKTGKQDPKQAYVDHKTGNILVTTGVADPKSGKVDSSLGQQFSIVEKDATKANREVGLVVITSKYDLRSKKLDPTYAHVDSVKGVLSGSDGKIYTDYGIIDPRTGDIQVTDPQTGRQEVKQGQVDPKTGNILLLSGVIDPRTNKLDTTLGQQYSIVDKPTDTFAALPGKEVQVVAVTAKYDSKNKKLDTPNGFVETSRAIISDKDGKVHTNFGVLDPNTGKIHFTDQKTGKADAKQALIDPKTGSFLITSGVIDPKTGKPDSALAQQLTVVDKDAPRGIPERRVNLVIVTSKYDPKSKKLDLASAHVDTIPGKIDIDDKVYSDYGVVDPTSGQITVTDHVSGRQEVKKASVDPKTGNLLLTSGVVDRKTGQVDSSLGQQISVVDKPKDTFASIPGKEVQLVSITSKYDPKHRRLDNPNGYVETSRGIVAGDGRVHSNFGVLDPKTGRIEAVDPKTGKQEIKQSVADPKTGHYILTSDVVDPKTGKIDSSLAQQLTVVDKAVPRGVPERYVNLVIVTTKYDPKSKKLDVTDAHIDTIPGTVGTDDKVHTEFGVVDPTTGQITVTDPATGKQEIKKAMVDSKTGNLLLTSGVVNPKTKQVDPALGQQISIVDKPTDKFGLVPGREVQLVAITSKYDPKNKKLDNPNGHVETSRGIVGTDGKVHSNLGIIDPKTGRIEYVNPETGKQDVKQFVTDPKTGHFLVTSGVVDPKTGKTDSSLAQQLAIVDKASKMVPGKYVNLVIVTTKYDPKNKKLDVTDAHIDTIPGTVGTDDKVHTEFLVVDPATGQIIVTDPVTGKQEIKKATLDPKTGNLLLTSSVFNPKTGQVDPTLGQQISIVDKPIDTFSSVPGREVQLVMITSKYDSKNKKLDNPNGHVETSRGIIGTDGKVHSNLGIIDPKTGGIEYVDPKTGKQEVKQTVIDPKTGYFLVTSGVVDPKTGKSDSSLAQQLAIVDKVAKRVPGKYVNLVIVTTKYDPKNKKLNVTDAHIDTIPGTVGADDKVHTEFGVIDPTTGQITVTDPVTGKQEIKRATVDLKTGNLLLTSSIVNPKTGQVDPTLGQQISIVDKPTDTFSSVPGREVQLVVITSKYDPKNKTLDNPNGHVETSRGIVGTDGKVHTNLGILDPKTGRIEYVDPKTGRQEVKQAITDPTTGHFLLTSGVVDPKTGKTDSSLAQQLTVVDKTAKGLPERCVNLVIVTTKYDPKNKKLDLTDAHVDTIPGTLDADGRVHTEYGVVDPVSGQIIITDPVTNKQDVKRATVDPKTGNLLLSSGVVNPKTGQIDPTLGQQVSIVEKPKDKFATIPGKEVQLVIITSKYDPKNKRLDNPNGHVETSRGIIAADGKVHTNFGIIDPKTGRVEHIDPHTGKQEIKQTVTDTKTGHLIITSGVVDPKTGKSDPSLAQQLIVVDKAPREKYVNLVIVTSRYDPKSKKLDLSNVNVDTVPGEIGPDNKVHTEFGVVDPTTGQIIVADPITGKQEVKKAVVDPQTGNLLLTSRVVDPKTGHVDPNLGQQISVVEKPKDKFIIVPGREIQLVVITNKYDPKNKRLDNPNGHIETSRGIVTADGKVHTNFGVIDPKIGRIEYVDPLTGKHEIKTAVADPKTGQLILTSGVIDPKTGKPDSSLAQQLSIVEKQVKPVQREIHLVIITTKYDPNTRKIDPTQAHVDTVSATVGPDGKIRTAVGVVDPVTGEITVTDPITGRQEVKRAQVDPTTGHMLISSNVVDPKTGRVDPTLVQQYSIVNKNVTPHTKPASIGEIRLVVVTSKYDPKTKTVDAGAGSIDASKGYVSVEDGKIHTDFGIIDPKSGQILYKDPVTGKQELKQAEIDPKTGNFIVTSTIIDPKTGKVDPSFAQQLTIIDKQNVLSRVAPVTQRVSISPVRHIPSPIKTPASTPVQTPLQSPVRTSSPIVSSSMQKASPITTTVQRAAPIKPTTAPPEPPKRKIVKIMVIFTKIDPKTRKPDLHTAEVEHLTGILDPNGLIETKYGVIDSNRGNIVVTDPAGQKQTKDGIVLSETGQIFINSGAVDPKTGRIDPNLGMILSVAKQDDPVVEITTITGPIDPRTGKVDIENGSIEHTKGKVDAETGHISTKYGVIDPSNGVIFVTDTTGAQDTKPVQIDENTGQVTITGVIDPKTGKPDPKLGQVLVVGTHIDPVVEVTTFVGKVDSKKGVIEPKNSVIESTTGQFNSENNKIDTKYGQIDLVKGTVTYNDPKTGKFESKEFKVDPITGQLLLRSGQVNPKSGKPDKDIGRLICLRIIQNKVDPVSGKQIVSNDPKNIKVDPKTNQIWTAGPKDPKTGEVLYTAGQIDPITGYIITIYGRLDPKTGTIIRTTDIDRSLIKVDPVNGQIYTATGEVDENNQPLYSASQVDPSTGEIYTKLGKIDPRTGRLIIIKIYVITQKDDKGRVKEVDPKECTIDETTGRIITTKTVYLYQIIDPITGETIDVDPDDPRLKGARTTVTQTMTLSGKIDPVTGRIKTEYGDIDPDTGDIDPSTAVRDPVTGLLILHYSQIDPSHFEDKSGNYTIEKETQDLPADIDIQTVNTHKFSTFGKDESPARGDAPKSFTEYTTSEHIKHQGYVSSTTPLSSKIPVSQRAKKTPTPPVVVKTTTKQLLTKNDEGVTHNVEQEVENLGTGEVTFSTHTNKAESLEPIEGKSPYVTARAVTTRTATTHHDLDTKAKTQQMEEKTVAHTLTSSATRQEQRVLTQEVKTMVTTGDQLARRGSESSLSSGDSGTPIDFDEGAGEGHYYTSDPGSYKTTTTTTVMGNAPFGSMVTGGTTRMSTGPLPTASESPEEPTADGEVVSSQTISSKTRTVETITYKTERNGVIETRVEQKITIQSDGDPIDHDRALAEAIQEATAMNPDMTVEKIEIQQQSTQQ